MKKEYFLLIFAIIALSAYLFLHNRDQDSNLLPQITKIDETKIEHIEIIKHKKTINCFKDGGDWVVTKNKFLGDTQVIKEMLASIKNLTITTLISEKGNLKRYDLDKDKSIKVIAKDKNKVLREFTIGKTVSTQKHTFITLSNQNNVFHATGNLKRIFNKSIDNLRDKQIQKIDLAEIKSIKICKGSLKKTITKKSLAEDNTEKPTQWITKDNTELNQESINALVETLSDLRCSSYIETQTKADFINTTPFLIVTLEADQETEFTLFPKNEQDKHIGISSDHKDLFILEGHIADGIISNCDDLLNINQES
ncbi:MAG: DUF4340 domain-containing protein [Desulfobacteraceae bacterium]|nr:DUF4340 domain-containing protein [Desulfobacteraceae bacterium]